MTKVDVWRASRDDFGAVFELRDGRRISMLAPSGRKSSGPNLTELLELDEDGDPYWNYHRSYVGGEAVEHPTRRVKASEIVRVVS